MLRLGPWVKQALDILAPSIEGLLKRANRPGFHFIILNPSIFPWKVDGDVEKAILHEGFIGEDDEKHDYRKIAISKTRQAWISGMPNIFVQTSAPALLDPEDTPYYGSFVHNGIVAAVSGLQPWFDELVSMWITCTFQQVTQHHRQAWLEGRPDDDFFS